MTILVGYISGDKYFLQFMVIPFCCWGFDDIILLYGIRANKAMESGIRLPAISDLEWARCVAMSRLVGREWQHCDGFLYSFKRKSGEAVFNSKNGNGVCEEIFG